MAIIGIDLGTSNSAAAVLRGGRPVIIPRAEGVSLGGKAFPSHVALTADGQMLVGELARRQAASNPEGTATAFKRKMGRRERIRLRLGQDLRPLHPGERADPRTARRRGAQALRAAPRARQEGQAREAVTGRGHADSRAGDG